MIQKINKALQEHVDIYGISAVHLFVADFERCEDNRVAAHQVNDPKDGQGDEEFQRLADDDDDDHHHHHRS